MSATLAQISFACRQPLIATRFYVPKYQTRSLVDRTGKLTHFGSNSASTASRFLRISSLLSSGFLSTT